MKNEDVRAIEGLINFLEKEQIEYRQIRDIAPIDEWLNSQYYVGTQSTRFFKFWKEHSIQFERGGYSEVILHGSTGGGKTDFAVMGFLRKFYMLSNFDFPQLMLGLGKGSSAIFFYMGITLAQASLTGFGRLLKYVDDSPYFQENFRRADKDSILEFPRKVIQCVAGSELGAFTGSDLLGIILDEGNFLRAGGGEIGAFNKAKDIYVASSSRIKNRYGTDSRFAFQAIISSANTMTSFVEERINESRSDPSVMIVHSTRYRIKPEDYSRQMFSMYLGDDNVNPFVIDTDKKYEYKNLLVQNIIPDVEDYLKYNSVSEVRIPETLKDKFVEIPVDFLKEGKLNPVKTLNEIAGIPVHSMGKFFTDHMAFQACIDYQARHPFRAEAFEVSTKNPDNELIDMWDRGVRGIKGKKYYGHLDLAGGTSKKKTDNLDSGALAFGHCGDTLKAIIDAQILVHPPERPANIDIDKFRYFVRWLKFEQGFDFEVFTTDQFQSVSTIQYFEKIKIKSFLYSMDRSDDPWEFGAQKISSAAVEFYYYPRLEFEVFSLIHNRISGKIDHPPQNGIHAKDGGYGNDISSCVFATINHVFSYARLNEERQRQLQGIVQMRKAKLVAPRFRSERDIIDYENRVAEKKFNYKEGEDPFMRYVRNERLKTIRNLGKKKSDEN